MSPTCALVNVVAGAPVAAESLGTVTLVRARRVSTVIPTPALIQLGISTLVNVVTLSIFVHLESALALTEVAAMSVDA